MYALWGSRYTAAHPVVVLNGEQRLGTHYKKNSSFVPVPKTH